MDIGEARALFAKSYRYEGRDDVGHANLVDDFWAADAAGQERYREAARVLFAQGSAEECELALMLWAGSSFDEAATDLIVDRYEATGDPGLAVLLGDTPTMSWSAPAKDRLMRRFLANPVAERRLANNVVSRCGAGTHAAYAQVLAAVDEVYALRRLWAAASLSNIETIYLDAVTAKAPELRRELAALFEEPWRSKIAS